MLGRTWLSCWSAGSYMLRRVLHRSCVLPHAQPSLFCVTSSWALCACRQRCQQRCMHTGKPTPSFEFDSCNKLIHICAMWDVRFLLVTAVLCHAIITRTLQSTRPFALELSPAQSKGRGVHRFGGPCDRGGLHGPEILRRSRLSDRGGRAAALARFRAAQGCSCVRPSS